MKAVKWLIRMSLLFTNGVLSIKGITIIASIVAIIIAIDQYFIETYSVRLYITPIKGGFTPAEKIYNRPFYTQQLPLRFEIHNRGSRTIIVDEFWVGVSDPRDFKNIENFQNMPLQEQAAAIARYQNCYYRVGSGKGIDIDEPVTVPSGDKATLTWSFTMIENNDKTPICATIVYRDHDGNGEIRYGRIGTYTTKAATEILTRKADNDETRFINLSAFFDVPPVFDIVPHRTCLHFRSRIIICSP